MGASGASSLWGHGVTDDQGPNNPGDLADDLVGCNDVKNAVGDAVLMNANMGCWDGFNLQATARSLHSGGVYVCFCDGHVTFISDFIDHNPNSSINGPQDLHIWERLMVSDDGLPLNDGNDY